MIPPPNNIAPPRAYPYSCTLLKKKDSHSISSWRRRRGYTLHRCVFFRMQEFSASVLCLVTLHWRRGSASVSDAEGEQIGCGSALYYAVEAPFWLKNQPSPTTNYFVLLYSLIQVAGSTPACSSITHVVSVSSPVQLHDGAGRRRTAPVTNFCFIDQWRIIQLL